MFSNQAVIKVIGVGGGGGNAVKLMIESSIENVEFIRVNTDAQALSDKVSSTDIQIGSSITHGLGAGTDPDIGRRSALEDRDRIADAIKGSNMVFITTGMGGGTGTGAAPVIAEIAREMGILTVAIVTTPFGFEGTGRQRKAAEGVRELEDRVDSLITIPNSKLLEVMGPNATIIAAFARADEVLCNAVRGISDIIQRPGLINVDFADIKAVMSKKGLAVMGSGNASGDDRAKKATEMAIQNPLLSGIALRGAKGVLVNITANAEMSLTDYDSVGQIVRTFAHDDATVKIGTVIDPDMRDNLSVTIVATGLDAEKPESFESRPMVSESLSVRAQAPEFGRASQRDVDFGDGAHHDQFGVIEGSQRDLHRKDMTHNRSSIHSGQRQGQGQGNFAPQDSSHRYQMDEQYDGARVAASRDSDQSIARRSARPGQHEIAREEAVAHPSDDYLDIPAFLRRGRQIKT